MNLDDKMIAEIAGQLGLKGSPGVSAADVKRLEGKSSASLLRLEGKSDAELEREILRIREQLAARGVTKPRQAAMLRSLLPMMDDNQKARLRKVIELIERH